MDVIRYKIQDFEGPLDLLLHLVDVNKIDLYDIPIAQITDQYMEYIGDPALADMETSSSFLVMASQLLYLKSRMLLPQPVVLEDGEEEEDPKMILARMLLEYKMFKQLGAQLKERRKDAALYCFKEETLPEDLEYEPKPVDLDALVGDMGLSDLKRIFEDVIKKSFDRVDVTRSSFGRIEEEPVDYKKKSGQIRSYIRKTRKGISFRKMLENTASRDEIIVTFLVILEMIREGAVSTRQDKLFDDILIEAAET